MPATKLTSISASDGTSLTTVRFADGWTVRLTALHAVATYRGHLEGAHTPDSNEHRLRALTRKAATLFPGPPVHLIAPPRTTGAVITDGPPGPDGAPTRREQLPAVCCIGSFEADPVPGADGCASGLTIVWFQDAPPPVPLEADLVNLLFGLDWDALAVSYWY